MNGRGGTGQQEEVLSPEQEGIRERLWALGFEIVQNLPQLHVSVDIEADGPMYGLGNMLSVGAVTPTGETFYAELKPIGEEHHKGQREFCEMHGLEHERLMEEGEEAESVLGNFADWTNEQVTKSGKGRPLMVGQAIAWDAMFIHAYFSSVGLENPYGIKPLDIASEAFSGIAEKDMDKTGKDDYPAIIRPDDDFPHHALEDAKIQMQYHYGVIALNALRNPGEHPDLINSELINEVSPHIE